MAASDAAPNATMRAIGAHVGPAPGWTVSSAVPFSSARKWSGIAFGDRGAWILGRPDVVLAVARRRMRTPSAARPRRRRRAAAWCSWLGPLP